MLSLLMNRFRSVSAAPARRARARPWRPLLEALEDRLAPAVFNPLAATPDGTANGSLRADIITADSNNQDNVINLQAGRYTLTIPNGAGGHEGAAMKGDLNLTAAGHTLVIQGAGPDVTVIDANFIDRAFQVSAGVTVVFRNLSIIHGKAQDDGTTGALPGTTDALGGGILDQGGNVTLDHVLLDINQAVAGGGAAGANGFNAAGGGVWTDGGTLTISNSTLENDFAFGGAGGAGVNNGNPAGAGGAGGAARGGGLYVGGGTASILNSTLSSNGAEGGGGGAGGANNPATGGAGGAGGTAQGGAVFVGGGTVQITASTLVHDVADGGGAGAGGNGNNDPGGAGGNGGNAGGGAVYVNAAAAVLTLSNSTVALDAAGGGPGGTGGTGGSFHGGNGGNGGFAVGGGIRVLSGTATLHNSTIAENFLTGGKAGGGGSGTPNGLAGSAGTAQGGGVNNAGTVNAVSTIFVNNSATTDPDFSGAFATAGSNLLEDGTGATGISNGVNGNLVGIDPKLRPLDYYGGPTQTFALYGDSPAIDHGSNPDGLTTDQRGYGPRDVNGVADIGAFEFGALPPPPTLPPGGVLVHPITVHPVKLRGRTWLEVFDASTGAFKGSVLPFRRPHVRVQWLTADVNGDGYVDVIAFAVINGGLRMRIFSGLNLAPL
jgi:hypothetical protein